MNCKNFEKSEKLIVYFLLEMMNFLQDTMKL